MEWQGGNKQTPNYWQWRQSFILGDSNWKSFQVGYPVDMYLSPNWMLSRVRSVKHLKKKMLWAEHIVVFWFPLLPHRFIAICHCRFLASFKNKNKIKEKHGKETPLFHRNQLQHTRSACFKTDLPDHFRFNSVQVVTEPCRSVVLLWCHGGHTTKNRIFSCRRRRCSKHRVCFHANQYFYVPQENVSLSNEQRVCSTLFI